MVFKIIIAFVLLIIAVLLLSPIKFYLKISDGISMYAGFLIFKVKLPLEKKKKAKSNAGEKQDGVLKKSKKDKNVIAKMIDEKGITATVSELWETFKPIVLRAIKLFKKIRVSRFSLKIITASDNAAKTALEYGGVCTAVFPMLSFLKQQMKFPDSKTRVQISADYELKKPVLFLDTVLKVRVITALTAAIGVLYDIFKIKLKKEVNKNKQV